MAIAPKWIGVLASDKASLVSSLQQSIDTSLHQFGSPGKTVTVTLPRGNYDAQVLEALQETYQALGWQMRVLQRDGAVIFECSRRQPQETR